MGKVVVISEAKSPSAASEEELEIVRNMLKEPIVRRVGAALLNYRAVCELVEREGVLARTVPPEFLHAALAAQDAVVRLKSQLFEVERQIDAAIASHAKLTKTVTLQ